MGSECGLLNVAMCSYSLCMLSIDGLLVKAFGAMELFGFANHCRCTNFQTTLAVPLYYCSSTVASVVAPFSSLVLRLWTWKDDKTNAQVFDIWDQVKLLHLGVFSHLVHAVEAFRLDGAEVINNDSLTSVTSRSS